MEFGVWSLEFGVWSLEFGVWSLEFGVWSLEFGVWSLEFGVILPITPSPHHPISPAPLLPCSLSPLIPTSFGRGPSSPSPPLFLCAILNLAERDRGLFAISSSVASNGFFCQYLQQR